MSELVILKNDKVFVESQVVAETFEKNHKNVLRDIKELEKVCSHEFWRLKIEPPINKSRRGE